MHEVLVNHLGGLSLPRKSVVRLTDSPNRTLDVYHGLKTGLPWSGKNILKMKFFPGQGKVREFCGWPGKFRKDLESQGKVREFKNKWVWQAVLRKFILFKREKDVHSHEIV